jgi:mRNA interferase MazF
LGSDGSAGMKRGDLVLIREPRTPAARPRPFLIIQHDSTLPDAAKITACPLTTTLRSEPGLRPLVMPSQENGLLSPSEVEFDWIHTFYRSSVGPRIGRLDHSTQKAVDTALRAWLDQ